MPEEQAGRAGADDRDLIAHDVCPARDVIGPHYIVDPVGR